MAAWLAATVAGSQRWWLQPFDEVDWIARSAREIGDRIVGESVPQQVLATGNAD